MKKILFFVFVIVFIKIPYAQEAVFEPVNNAFFATLSAKELAPFGGHVKLNLNRSNDDYDALISFNASDYSPAYYSTNRWNLGLSGDDDFRIFRVSNSNIYNAIIISDDANNDGTEDDPSVEIASGAQLKFGNNGGVLRGTGILGDIEIDAFNLIPKASNITALGSSARRFRSVWVLNGTVNTSDGRLKKNIKTIHYGLNDLMKLNPVAYNWKDNRNTDAQIGLIAQEVLKVVPEAVVTSEVSVNEEGEQVEVPAETMGIKYAALIPVLISSIQEQQETIESLLIRIEQLESK